MSQLIHIHSENPQHRLIAQAVAIIRNGGVIVYPTDSCYALGCHIGDKGALDRIRRIRGVDEAHNFTLVCRDLAEASVYAKVDNQAFRFMKALTPGPYTFILRATHEVPRRLQHARRKTIGLRIPRSPIATALLNSLGEPLMSTTLLLSGRDRPMTDTAEMLDTLGHAVDLVIDGGDCGIDPTTVIDLQQGQPEVLREGKGDVSHLFR